MLVFGPTVYKLFSPMKRILYIAKSTNKIRFHENKIHF